MTEILFCRATRQPLPAQVRLWERQPARAPASTYPSPFAASSHSPSFSFPASISSPTITALAPSSFHLFPLSTLAKMAAATAKRGGAPTSSTTKAPENAESKPAAEGAENGANGTDENAQAEGEGVVIVKLTGGKPDPAHHNAEMDSIKAKIDGVQAKVVSDTSSSVP